MSYDYSKIPLEALRRETLLRSREVSALNNRAWDTMPGALVGAIVATLMAAGIIGICLQANWFFAVLLVLPVAMFIASNAPWRSAISACREYTNEMKARTAELNRRKAAP